MSNDPLNEYHYGTDRTDFTRGNRPFKGDVGTYGIPKPNSKVATITKDAKKKLRKKKEEDDEPETELDAMNSEIEEAFQNFKTVIKEFDGSPRGYPGLTHFGAIGSAPTVNKINGEISKLKKQRKEDVEKYGEEEAEKRFQQALNKLGVRYK
jgi:hypothetical protein